MPGTRRVSIALVSIQLGIVCLFSCKQTDTVNRRLDGNEATLKLLLGIGSLHHPIRTSNPEAQQFFDQGLTFVYAFNFPEAIRSFQRAAELDSTTPMPYWGIALALAPNYNSWGADPQNERRACDAVNTARRLYTHSPDNERAYIDAVARDFTVDEKPDRARLERDYANAMGDLSRRYPDDPDAAVLYAAALMQLRPWHLWMLNGAPAEGTTEIESTLAGALRRWPDHVGANHYYIHLMEGSLYPERALPSAYRLETLVPLAGHLIHMPSHIYFRTGDYARAVGSNLQAMDADAKYAAEGAVSGSYRGYAVHNLYFLYFSAAMDGDFRTALDAATKAQAAGSHAFWAAPLLALLRFGHWQQVLALPPPDDSMLGERMFWHYARGCAFAHQGNLRRADQERNDMEEVYGQIPPGRAFGMFFNDWSTLHEVALNALNARIAAAQNDDEGAIRYWRHAIAVQDGMNFDDLPDWYYPVSESLGSQLFRCGRFGQAEQVFRDDLTRTPRNPRSLYGLWKTLEAEKRTSDAVWVKQQFETAWKGGPGDLHLEDF